MISYNLLFLVTVVIWFLIGKKKKRGNLPPGPNGIPLFGNLLQIGKRMERKLTQWADEYGGIYYIKLGFEKVVVVSDHKLIKEMLSQEAFSGRVQNEMFTVFADGPFGVVSSEGQLWEAQRRFTLRHLRDFGFGKNYMENLILDEVKDVLDYFKKTEGNKISLHGKFSIAVLNSLWVITGGQRFPQDDERLIGLVTTLIGAFNVIFETGYLIFAPWLRHIAPEVSGWNKLNKACEKIRKVFQESVEEHMATYNGDHIRDFVDNYIHEIKKTTDPSSSFHGELGLKNLKAVTGDLFVAGSETTSTSLTWAMLFLSAYPRIQAKVQEEIDQVVGNSRQPSLQDRSRMPYTEAVLYETLRLSTLLPTGVFHRALETKVFQGYEIPKGAWIIANIHAVHTNKKIWGDPENFRPERFLTEDGKSFKKHEAFIAFQAGRRQCLGEPLAKDTLFLFISSIFQKFNVYHDDEVKPDFESIVGFTNAPKPFQVVMEERIQ